MSDFKKIFLNATEGIEQKFDDLTFRFRKKLRLNDPLQIVVYRSYGTTNRLYIKGRVLEDKGIKASTNHDSIWKNLLSMYQRFESDEVPGAVLKVKFQNEVVKITTDSEGYFTINLIPSAPLISEALYYEIEVELIEAPLPFNQGLKSTAQVLVPPIDSEYGIISDIDDTIIKTSATNLLAMSRTVFLNNAYTRLPFAGVAEFYRALQLGRNGKRNNPFFYVSSSPWNLYDLLIDFLDLNKIPAGPLLLRDFGLQDNKLISTGHMGHKFKEIENILLTYPDLNFVLIGDSGQEDPKIYQAVVTKYPDRILAIYIRDVQLPDREKIAVTIAHELKSTKVEMLIIDNTVEAAKHAAKNNLIYNEAIPQIIEDKKKDSGELPGKEEISTT